MGSGGDVYVGVANEAVHHLQGGKWQEHPLLEQRFFFLMARNR